jgi:VWFA-related protein
MKQVTASPSFTPTPIELPCLYNNGETTKEDSMKTLRRLTFKFLIALSFVLVTSPAFSQQTQARNGNSRGIGGPGKPVTIPVTIRTKDETAVRSEETYFQNIDLVISEDGEPQTILSVRGIGTNSPITLAVLIQDDLVPSVGNEIKDLAEFIRKLPKGSRVMVGNLRTGSLQVRQKFTNDLERAASALRPPSGFSSASPYNPYVEVIEALRRFEGQPLGRRAILLVSDGLDVSRGVDSSSPSQSVDLQRAVNESQRRGVAIYGFYAPTTLAAANPALIANAQSSLLRLSDETGGIAFFQGTGAPVSFRPFIRELDIALQKQAALTFLSTHLKKGFHKIEVKSSTPGVRVAYPSGYVRN